MSGLSGAAGSLIKDKLSYDRLLSRKRGLCTHSLKRANSEMEVITKKNAKKRLK